MDKKTTTLLLQEMKDIHGFFQQTLEGVSDEVASFMPPGKANPISGLYAHAVMSEDFFTSMLSGGQPLFLSSWKDKTGASEIQPTDWETAYPRWLKEVKVDMAKMTEYAKAVYAGTEKYLESLVDKDIQKQIDMSMFGMGSRSQGAVIMGLLYGHLRDIMGEISAIKGIQGLKGYPF